MLRIWSLLLWLAFASTGFAQALTRQNLAGILGFENSSLSALPAGWVGFPTDTIFVESRVVHSGNYSARIERNASSSGTFSYISAALPLDFEGKTIEWRGFIKSENVNGHVALWLREDGDTQSLAFASLQGLNLNGTRDWAEYSVSVSVVPQGKQLVFGFLLSGTGKGWVDDLSLLVDGKPVALPSPLSTDHEFDAGSHVNVTNLSTVQIKNLATLAQVWGFLKYHHPTVTEGLRHWDYDLFRILPQVLDATDSGAANAAISSWIAGLGNIVECTDCATLNSDNLYLSPSLDWIADESLLGAGLSRTLQSIHRNRKPAAKQYYISLTPNVGNPKFENELAYGSITLPDAGYQLLALFRYWNMVQYFYPNRDVMADDPARSPNYWSDVLVESIPGIALAPDSLTYQQELMKFIAKINDTHANLWTSIAVRPPTGSCQLPVDVRFIEGRPLVLRYISATAGPASGLLPGDLIEQLDGTPVNELLNQWRPFYADSNEAARLRDIGRYMTRGPCGTATVAVRRGETALNLTSSRVPVSSLDFSASYTHDLPGEAFQIISNQIAYLKLSAVQAANSASYIQAAAGTKGLIIDIRNYPSEFVVFTLGQLLVSEPTEFVRFTNADMTNPGAFHWRELLSLTPQQPHYSGKVVILVDEVTQSSAEYHTMAFRSAPGATVIGSTTAGADGNVSTVLLPGGYSSYISGIGVFYPDKRPTQRVGIIPDIEVRPTIEGIRAGRDELLERAIQILSPESTLEITIPAGGAASASTVGSGGPAQTGYAAATIASGGAPHGVAVFSIKQNGVTVSEAGVPASPPTTAARVFIDYRSSVAAIPGRISAGTINVNTGIAVVNCGTASATVSYTLRDIGGATLSTGRGPLAAGAHFAKFIDQLNEVAEDFVLPASFEIATQFASLDISSDQPLSILALRMTTNQRREVLYTTTPIADLTQPLSYAPIYFPQFADGGGYTTSLVLLNTSEGIETGTLQILDDEGNPFVVNPVGGAAESQFRYSIPKGGFARFQTDGYPATTKTGWAQLRPDAGTSTPIGAGVFSNNPGDFLINESGVPAAASTTHARVYVDLSGGHKTGLAIGNPANINTSITITAYQSDGVTGTGAGQGPLSLPAHGHTAHFANEFIDGLPAGFTGVLDITSSIPFSVLTMRSLYNERNDFLLATFPVADMTEPAPSPIVFPQIVDAGGYMTQFILIGAGGESSVTLSFHGEDGKPLAIGNSGMKRF